MALAVDGAKEKLNSMQKLFDYSLRGEPRIFRQYLSANAPRVVVDAGAGDGITWSLSREFVDEGWRALLLEDDPALFRQLSSNCKDLSNVTCIQSLPGSQAVKSHERKSLLGGLFGKIRNRGTTLTADPQPLSAVLAEHHVAQEIGVLIVNSAEGSLDILQGADLAQFRPWLIVTKDEQVSSENRSRKYRLLSGAGYKYSGVAGEYSIWNLNAIANPSLVAKVSLPQLPERQSGRAAFDQPPGQGASAGMFGASNVLIAGWAFDEATSSVPPLVYLKLEDRLTGTTEYIQAYRCSRPDVAANFRQPQLAMAGFRALAPLGTRKSGAYSIQVVQVDEEATYRSAAEFSAALVLEDFEKTTREGLARKFLYGSGIEIGALQRTLAVPSTATVRYVDRFGLQDLLSHYPELNGIPLQAPDIIDDGETLSTIADVSQDFLIANHFFEHCENPIKAFENLLRKLKSGGILYMAVPDKRYTFDSERPVTNYETLRTAYQTGSRPDRESLFHEWAHYAERRDGSDAEARAAELLATNYSIHYNVWTVDELLDFLYKARGEFALPFQIASVVCCENEAILVVRRS